MLAILQNQLSLFASSCVAVRASDEADIRDRVVRRTEWALGAKAVAAELAAHAVHLRGLDGLLEGDRGHDGGNALREHRLPAAGRADEEQRVIAGDGDLDRALHLLLAFHFGEIDLVPGRAEAVECRLGGLDLALADEEFVGLAQRAHTKDLHAAHDGGLRGIREGQDDGLFPQASGLDRDGECSLDGTHLAIESQLAGDHAAIEPRDVGVVGHGDHAQGDGQVETRAFFFQVRGREVHGGAVAGPAEAAVRNGGGHTVATLAHRGIGQADDHDLRLAVPGIHLYHHFARVHSTDRRREDPREHPSGLSARAAEKKGKTAGRRQD